MTKPPSRPITQLLAAVGQGDTTAHEKLWKLVYKELRAVAGRQMAQEGSGRTLQATALVHEAYIRLVAGEDVKWTNRRHFFAAAAEAMRRIRIDYARKRESLKRGGGEKAEPLWDEAAVFDQNPAEVLAVNEALGRLKGIDSRKVEVVMLRFFAGLSIAETAEALELSPRTVDSDWRFARFWLHRELSKGDTAVGQESCQ